MDDIEEVARRLERLEKRVDELEEVQNDLDRFADRLDRLDTKITGHRGLEQEVESLKRAIDGVGRR